MAQKWTAAEEDARRKELIHLYVEKNKTITEIAVLLGIAESTVYDRLQRLDIPSLRHKKLGYNNTHRDIVIPSNYSEDLAECVGILLGDGHLSPTQITVTLGTKEHAYVRYVATLMQRLFAVKPRILKKKQGHYVVYLGSTELVKWFLSMGLAHHKVRSQVSMPSWIFADARFMRRALRGLWDTDGSVYKLRFGIQFSFCNCSEPLLCSVRMLLSQLGFHPSEIARAGTPRIYLTRREELYTFFNTIGFKNPKHSRRFLQFARNFASVVP